MKLIIINGPNLNLLGTREPNLYGSSTFETYFNSLESTYKSMAELEYYQSNVEGEIINKLHEINKKISTKIDGIILNAGGYTHTSVAIADAIAAIDVKVVEVHISNIFAREEYRHISFMSKNCVGTITGFGLKSYDLAIDYFLKK
ncbi:MAG: type II 3-dehydroquinate dehydratase [Candidatus Methylacidiphilales bacterium]